MVVEAVYIDAIGYNMAPLFFFLGLIILLAFLKVLVQPRKSVEYRRLLTDMYVSGKVKQIASKEGVNLIDEMKEFTRFIKKTGLNEKAFDNTLEDELQEKMIDEFEKTKEKK